MRILRIAFHAIAIVITDMLRQSEDAQPKDECQSRGRTRREDLPWTVVYSEIRRYISYLMLTPAGRPYKEAHKYEHHTKINTTPIKNYTFDTMGVL